MDRERKYRMFQEFADVGGKKILVSTGSIAKQANGSVLIRQGDTVVIVTAVMSQVEREGIDFVPLTVEYRERTAAAGRVPGGFFKREMRPSDHETLTSRIIDRSLRPLFPKTFRNETQVLAFVLSFDPDADPKVLALSGASLALHLSDIPWKGPIAGLRVGQLNGQFLANPSTTEREEANLDLMVTFNPDGMVMVEGKCEEVSEDTVLEALEFARETAQPLLKAIEALREQVGKPKKALEELLPVDPPWAETVRNAARPELTEILHSAAEKFPRRDAIQALEDRMVNEFKGDGEDQAENGKKILQILEKLLYEEVRRMLVEEGLRVDGRDAKTIRPISGTTGWLPRTHGSALFTRGETQAMVSCTLGTGGDEQIVERLNGEEREQFMLHYNFPPYCVGEARFLRGPGRREIGHGNLARRALEPILPSNEEFPYTIRVVSDISESNGSSSMATVCGGTLVLMDAGVPIKAPVAGIAMGLVKEGDKTVVLSDILGDEDHLGDMDFKVAGTRNGITALQLDNKLGELPREVLVEGLEQAKQGRNHILDEMDKILDKPREDLSPYAPRTHPLRIRKERIRDLIGPQGRVIQQIQAQTNVQIEVNDDGLIRVYSTAKSDLDAALQMIKFYTADLEVGKIYKGTVVSVKDFGAFVKVYASTEGLVHISELDNTRVNKVSDVVQEGDEILVKVLDVDRLGKIRLSRKAALGASVSDIES
jgi:polyribonucleotide nucleotidyltransferase